MTYDLPAYLARHFKRGKAAEYLRRTLTTLAWMRPHLPPAGTGPDVLDVGCGLAAMSLALADHYGPATRLHLLDGDARSPSRAQVKARRLANYDRRTPPWQDAAEPAAEFRALGLWAHNCPADPALTVPADVIVSTRSWGHHYPVAVYLDLAVRSLRPGGRLFLDVRSGTGGLDVLGRHFDVLDSVDFKPGVGKCLFVACKRKGAP